MKKATAKDLAIIMPYLRQEIEKCLYMYADITVYRLNNPNMDVWFDSDSQGVCHVVMRYHRSFQIYSNRDFENLSGIVALVEAHKPNTISGRKEMIQSLEVQLDNRYIAEYGVVFRARKHSEEQMKERLSECDVDIVLAEEGDALAIAELLYIDDEVSSAYTKETLSNELKERIQSKMGRSYIIKDGDVIVAHTATYAEAEPFVVVSGLMVHPSYRYTRYAEWIDAKSCLEYNKEGKQCYFFSTKPRIIKMHKMAKNDLVAEYGKLKRIQLQ